MQEITLDDYRDLILAEGSTKKFNETLKSLSNHNQAIYIADLILINEQICQEVDCILMNDSYDCSRGDALRLRLLKNYIQEKINSAKK